MVAKVLGTATSFDFLHNAGLYSSILGPLPWAPRVRPRGRCKLWQQRTRCAVLKIWEVATSASMCCLPGSPCSNLKPGSCWGYYELCLSSHLRNILVCIRLQCFVILCNLPNQVDTVSPFGCRVVYLKDSSSRVLVWHLKMEVCNKVMFLKKLFNTMFLAG